MVVAIAGPPASGKSTLAEALAQRLNNEGTRALVVPMDGFHLDNAVLAARDMLHRKGAPETFDAKGFITLIGRLKAGGEVVIPVFDRSRDIAVAGAAIVSADCRLILVEGNYLLFDEAPWRDLAPVWDLSVLLDVRLPELRRRLIRRWQDHGLDLAAATLRAELNDLPNATRVLNAAITPDITLPGDAAR
ncbi:nucleoside/nucleotide kinase family protein [Pseudogemmobacter sp. W21_MBD1_M6]